MWEFIISFCSPRSRRERWGRAIFVCRETTTNKKVHTLKITIYDLTVGLEFLPNRRLPIGQKWNSLRTQRLCDWILIHRCICFELRYSDFGFEYLMWGILKRSHSHHAYQCKSCFDYCASGALRNCDDERFPVGQDAWPASVAGKYWEWLAFPHRMAWLGMSGCVIYFRIGVSRFYLSLYGELC